MAIQADNRMTWTELQRVVENPDRDLLTAVPAIRAYVQSLAERAKPLCTHIERVRFADIAFDDKTWPLVRAKFAELTFISERLGALRLLLTERKSDTVGLLTAIEDLEADVDAVAAWMPRINLVFADDLFGVGLLSRCAPTRTEPSID